MSIDVMKLVWDKSQHKETNLVALLALADMANTDGFCWPSHDTLAKRCRCNRRNIVYIIEKLEASCEIYVEHNRGRNRSNRYMITIDTTAAKLADLFVKYFDMSATEAVDEAKKHLGKCATESNNVQSTAHLDNVQQTAHLTDAPKAKNVQPSVNNVQPSALKCATDCTRSVNEPSIEPKRESTAITAPLPTQAAQPSLQQPSFNTGSKYQNKQQNQVSEYIKKAKVFGLTAEDFRLIVDTVLEGLGTKNRANTGNDEVLKQAQSAANELIHYESGRFRTVEAVKSIFESWTANDYRGDTLPTCEQFLHHAGLVDMNKVVRTRKTPTAIELSQMQQPAKKVLAFKEFCLKEFTTDVLMYIPGGEAAARERYNQYKQQQTH